MSHVDVIVENLDGHPCCPHGPTILFSRVTNRVPRRFFACSACRDRKTCRFFLWEDEKEKMNRKKLASSKEQNDAFIGDVDHNRCFATLNKVGKLPINHRSYCYSCNTFVFEKNLEKHAGHSMEREFDDKFLEFPLQYLPPLSDDKKEAQYLFSRQSIETIVNILKNLGVKNVITIGAPRIHEYVKNIRLNGFLLDIDKRLHNFFGPKEFSWYNLFNNHFFLSEGKDNFQNFVKNDCLALVTDPPFGGRVELIADTLKKIGSYCNDLKIFWIYPYFMEPQILNYLPNFCMLDYKVEYENHSSFHGGKTGRKQGSPVRIFTNVDPSLIKLPADHGYKYCKLCKKWVANENNHCKKCMECTSKNGVTYKHCDLCEKCVKPTWMHCEKCKRCALSSHSCQEIEFIKECFHCKEIGHKRKDCPGIGKKPRKRRC